MYSVSDDSVWPLPGFPIRSSPDQCLLGNSPRLFAACYDLHQLYVSRHPPFTLESRHTVGFHWCFICRIYPSHSCMQNMHVCEIFFCVHPLTKRKWGEHRSIHIRSTRTWISFVYRYSIIKVHVLLTTLCVHHVFSVRPSMFGHISGVSDVSRIKKPLIRWVWIQRLRVQQGVICLASIP